MPFGAECRDDGSVRFRLWAPKATSVEILLCNPESPQLSLSRQSEGWFELVTAGLGKKQSSMSFM
jgi:1,4-alpha-glucan branching enzyme